MFSMSYLIFIHWYRWYLLTSYSVDITGPFMVVVQRVTTIAFSMHDGRVKNEEELNEIQKREAIRCVALAMLSAKRAGLESSLRCSTTSATSSTSKRSSPDRSPSTPTTRSSSTATTSAQRKA